MIDNFCLIFFTLCMAYTIHRAVKLEREERAVKNQKK